MPAVIPSSSIEYIRVPITASVELNTQVVEMQLTAKTPTGSPPQTPVAWQVAAWVGAAGTTRTCRSLFGPLTAGQYDAWVKIQDSPEAPVRVAGTVTVT